MRRHWVARRWFSGLLAVLAGLAGCSVPVGGEALYGPPSAPGDPTVAITDFSYTPAGPIYLGDKVRFTARLNKQPPRDQINWLVLRLGGAAFAMANPSAVYPDYLYLNDSGLDGDTAANDLIFSKEMEWGAPYTPVAGLPVVVEWDWWDSTPDLQRIGPPLTIIDPEEETMQ
jgi:hypothetical protein